MLDPTGHAPGAVPPLVLSALRGDAEVRTAAQAAGTTPDLIRADRALARLDAKLAELAKVRAAGTAASSELAFQLSAALLEVGQAALAAYVTARDGVAAASSPSAPVAPPAPPSTEAKAPGTRTLAEAISAIGSEDPIGGFLFSLRDEARS